VRRFGQVLLFSLALGLVSLYLVTPNLFTQEIVSAFKRVDLRIFLIAPFTVLGWWLLAGYRTVLLARCTGSRLNLWQAVQTHVVGVFSAVLTPAGGGNSLGLALILMRFGISPENAAAISVMYVVGDMAFFAWALPASLAVLKLSGMSLPIPYLSTLIFILSGLALLGSYLLVFRLSLAIRLLKRVFDFPIFHRLRSRSHLFFQDLELASERFAEESLSWHLGFHLLSGSARLCFYTVLNIVLLALGVTIKQSVVLSIQIIIHSFAFLIPTPGASGYHEATISYALKGEVAANVLATSVILWRFFNHYSYFLLGPLIGGFALLSTTKSQSKRRQ
jgi:uncharacterized protein (TIRG00374 family)